MYILVVALNDSFVIYNLKIPSSFPFLCYFDGKKEATEVPEFLLENRGRLEIQISIVWPQVGQVLILFTFYHSLERNLSRCF